MVALKSRLAPLTTYLRPDVRERFLAFKQKYPTQSESAFVNAALLFYLAYADRGVDGNLAPYTLQTGHVLPAVTGHHDQPEEHDQAKEIIRDIVREVLRDLGVKIPSPPDTREGGGR